MIGRLLRSDLVFHGSIVFAGLIVANALNYLYFMLCGRVLGVEGYGEVIALTSAVLTLAAPANVAQIVVARLIAEFDASGDRDARDRFGATAVRATLLAGGALALAGILAAQPIASFFHVASPWPIVVAALSLGLYATITVQRGVMQGAHRFGAFSASYCIESLLRTGAGVLLAIRYGSLGALIGLLIGVAGGYAYGALAVRAPRRAGAPRALNRAWIAFVAWRIGLGQLVLTVLSFYDVVLVRHVFGARESGLYAAAALVGRVVLGLLAFVPTLVMPKVTARAGTGASAVPVLAAGVGVALAIVAVSVAVTFFLPAQVVTLFAGRAFAAAAPLVPLYVLASGALGIAGVVAAYQFGLHHYAFVAPATVAALAEIAVIAVWHPSAGSVVAVLLAGHAVVLGATLVGLRAPRHRDTSERLLAAVPR